MTPEQQRIAIAECLGWTNVHYSHSTAEIMGKAHDGKMLCEIPDYPNDLNACAWMESALTSDESCQYVDGLYKSMMSKPGFLTIFIIVHATATQRCEAFLRTKGLWKEETK